MQTVAETPIFIRRAQSLLSEEEHFDLITYLATHPTVGDEIVGTGGVRKVRYGAMGRGKSGGVRVIYYFYAVLSGR
jgi:mRNA-degrading endonuclease RelE of RelBE toxin-antitoxin system